MKRDIIEKLIKWKDSPRRKPLILTGVRQCGKTYSLKEFGSLCFESTFYVNFEESRRFAAVFEYDYDVNRIIKELELMAKQKIVLGKTLVIFDEIQECPRAITSLKYFNENLSNLHLICAGSLLGVAIKQENISFPVGKVNRMQMYPMSFKEFLSATEHDEFVELFTSWKVDREIPDAYAIPMKRLLKEYYYVGGMPEAVKCFVDTGDIEEVATIQKEILSDYADDFSKHAPVAEIEKLRMIWDSIPKQLAKENNKFVFSHVKEGKRAHELENALQWLNNAGLIHLVELVQNAEVPLAAYADATYFKVYMSDIGLLGRQLGLSYMDFINMEDAIDTFKGAIVENYVLNELIVAGNEPYFWRSGNTAEIDFIYEKDGTVCPVEVKAAINTQAKSYKTFCKKYTVNRGYKLSLKNIAENDVEGTKTLSLPLYLLWNIDGII